MTSAFSGHCCLKHRARSVQILWLEVVCVQQQCPRTQDKLTHPQVPKINICPHELNPGSADSWKLGELW